MSSFNAWSVAGPVARLTFATSDESSDELTRFTSELTKIAGIKNKGYWLVPFNALAVVNDLLAFYPSVGIGAATWEKAPNKKMEWHEVEALLRKEGSLREWVYEFYTPYQKQAIAFGFNKDGCHFWHPTGSGKTLSGVSVSLSVPGPVIIVTRAASRLQYAREIGRFTHSTAYVMRPSSDFVGKVTVKGQSFKQFARDLRQFHNVTKGFRQLWDNHLAEHGPDPLPTMENYLEDMKIKGLRPFIVCGWESLPDNLDRLMAIQPGCVVYDELHRGKGFKRHEVISLSDLPEDPEQASAMMRKDANDARAKGGFIKTTEEGRKLILPVKNVASSAGQLARAAKKRLGTTATSVSNRVKDLWGQLDTIEPNAWGNASLWQDRYCDRHPGAYGGFDISGESNKEELKKRLDTVVHFLDYRETHKHLPPKRRQSYYIAPSDQVDESGGFAKELKEAAKRGPTSILEVKLAMAASRKRKAVLSLIEDHVLSNHKITVFTGRRRDCDELSDIVRKALKGVTTWSAHGEHSDKLRQSIVDEYMDHPGPCVLVATGQSLGESINLQDTDAAVFVMLPYSPGQLRQWEGRFARLAQKRPVTIYYVIAEGTVDERVCSILIDKLPAVESIGKDAELAEAMPILAGIDPNKTPEEFAQSILANIEDRGLADDDWSDWD